MIQVQLNLTAVSKNPEGVRVGMCACARVRVPARVCVLACVCPRVHVVAAGAEGSGRVWRVAVGSMGLPKRVFVRACVWVGG